MKRQKEVLGTKKSQKYYETKRSTQGVEETRIEEIEEV